MSNDIICIKVVIDGDSVEVKGPWQIVRENFVEGNLMENLLNQASNASRNNRKPVREEEENVDTDTLNSKYERTHNGAIEITESLEPESSDDSNEKYIPLSEVLKKNLAGREVEKLLMLIFYLSNFGKVDFNREEILSQYEDEGITSLSRTRNLSNNLQTLKKYQWIGGSNPKYYMTDEGIFRAKGILARDVASEKRYN